MMTITVRIGTGLIPIPKVPLEGPKERKTGDKHSKHGARKHPPDQGSSQGQESKEETHGESYSAAAKKPVRRELFAEHREHRSEDIPGKKKTSESTKEWVRKSFGHGGNGASETSQEDAGNRRTERQSQGALDRRNPSKVTSDAIHDESAFMEPGDVDLGSEYVSVTAVKGRASWYWETEEKARAANRLNGKLFGEGGGIDNSSRALPVSTGSNKERCVNGLGRVEAHIQEKGLTVDLGREDVISPLKEFVTGLLSIHGHGPRGGPRKFLSGPRRLEKQVNKSLGVRRLDTAISGGVELKKSGFCGGDQDKGTYCSSGFARPSSSKTVPDKGRSSKEVKGLMVKEKPPTYT